MDCDKSGFTISVDLLSLTSISILSMFYECYVNCNFSVSTYSADPFLLTSHVCEIVTDSRAYWYSPRETSRPHEGVTTDVHRKAWPALFCSGTPVELQLFNSGLGLAVTAPSSLREPTMVCSEDARI